MAGLKRFTYTTKDHEDIVNDCIERIKQVYSEESWNDFEEDNAGRMLVESFAYIADLLLFYLDRQANETYLPTATERQNLINMCKLIGYTTKNATSAQVNIKLSLDSVHSLDVTLPASSQLATNSGLIFETVSDAVIKAGELSTNVEAIEGETFTEVVGTSDGEEYQEFYLSRSGVVEIQSVNIDNSEWLFVDSFAGQLENSKVYSTEIDAWQRGKILFGNGKQGEIPENGERISVTYRVGGGVAGNVAPNTITSVRDIATDSDGNSIVVKITNEDWASGGSEPESIESIKLWAPRFYEAQDRCVTQQDYEAFAMKYDGIIKSRAIVRERTGEANVIRVYVLTYGQTANSVALPNQTLKDNLLLFLNRYKMLTDWLEIEDGKWRNVDFSGKIIISDGFSSEKILPQVKAALTSLMSIETREMGEPLRISDVYAAIDNIEGVIFVELDTPTQTIVPEINELLVLGNINFSFALRGSLYHGQNF